MRYESPIQIIMNDIRTTTEDNIMNIVQSYGIEVDKEELTKALNYDRCQYEKGYRDGRYDRFHLGVKPYKVGNRWHCGECSVAIGRMW